MLLAFSSSGEAQQPRKIPRILLVSSYPKSVDQDRINAFRQGLHSLGYVEGSNVATEYRWYGHLTRHDRKSTVINDLRGVDVDLVIVSGGLTFTADIKEAVVKIPIIMTTGSDPVESGLISSLARPGGNLTGLTSVTSDLSGKRLELVKESVPKLSRVAILYDGGNSAKVLELKETQGAARDLQLDILSLDVRKPADFDRAFQTAAQEKARALITLQNPLTVMHLKRISELALNGRLPMMVAERGLLEQGGLMSYGPDYSDLYRRAATYVDKILKGANPGHLPVEQPTKFELVINLKTAKQIGLTIPPNVLARADKVVR